jgi:hypothetical protein
MVTVMPDQRGPAVVDPDVAHNSVHRVIQWEADLMDPTPTVVVTTPAMPIESVGGVQ